MYNLTKEDFDFIEASLNQTWNDAHKQLTESKALGDIEKNNLIKQRDKAKELLVKLDRI